MGENASTLTLKTPSHSSELQWIQAQLEQPFLITPLPIAGISRVNLVETATKTL